MTHTSQKPTVTFRSKGFLDIGLIQFSRFGADFCNAREGSEPGPGLKYSADGDPRALRWSHRSHRDCNVIACVFQSQISKEADLLPSTVVIGLPHSPMDLKQDSSLRNWS